MKIHLLTIGSIKQSWLKDGCAFYEDRLQHHFDFSVLELTPSKSPDAGKQRTEESEKVLEKIHNFDGDVWVLTEHGKELSSAGLAESIGALGDQGRSLLIVLGGAYGLNDAVLKAGKKIALSQMTFPHDLCRLVVFEQLYRAGEILKGSGYHHQG